MDTPSDEFEFSGRVPATADDGLVTAPSTPSGPTRRRTFTPAQKLKYLSEYETACETGGGNAYLRGNRGDSRPRDCVAAPSNYRFNGTDGDGPTGRGAGLPRGMSRILETESPARGQHQRHRTCRVSPQLSDSHGPVESSHSSCRILTPVEARECVSPGTGPSPVSGCAESRPSIYPGCAVERCLSAHHRCD